MRLIDADAFCEKWKEVRKSEYLDDFARGYQAGIFAMDAAPTVDAEPVKHGHWIFVRDRYLCSICGEDAPIDSFVRDARHKERQYMAPYCYECGTKMDEEAGHEDTVSG